MSAITRDFYKVALVGQPGRGKTYAFRNMNPETTGFINIEDKPVPFPNKFKYHARPRNVAETKKALKDFADNAEIDVICVDSFSAYVELLLAEARVSKRGFDIWNYYNEEIGKFLNFIKSIQKEVFITAHYETLDLEGNPQRRVKVKGKEWEGLIEKEFTVVLYADSKFNRGIPEYFLTLAEEGSSAKCPPGLICEEGTYKVGNDCNEILKGILNFVEV